MKIRFFSNAGCSYESQGKTLLCDPWLIGGAFYGAWFHYPPLRTKPQDVANADYLYLSHIHPDHFDPETLKHFRRDIPVIALDHGESYLVRFLERDGFKVILRMEDGETRQIGPFKVTMFAPFVKHPFHPSELGNPLDSSIFVQDEHDSVLNTNDNTPSLEAAKAIIKRFGPISVAQLNYNAAGPYPACFKNLKRKHDHSKRIISRNLLHMVKVAKILKPRFVMPFAGQFVIGGKNANKTAYSGTVMQDAAGDYLERNGLYPLLFNEGQSIDLRTGMRSSKYFPERASKREAYIKSLEAKKYHYEFEAFPYPDELLIKLRLATTNLLKACERLKCYPKTRVIFHLGDQPFNVDIVKKPDVTLNVFMDTRLLTGILERRYHWNNAEIGSHIEFHREPDVYQPDLHTLLSFFH